MQKDYISSNRELKFSYVTYICQDILDYKQETFRETRDLILRFDLQVSGFLQQDIIKTQNQHWAFMLFTSCYASSIMNHGMRVTVASE